MEELVLYGTAGCHLCETAMEMLAARGIHPRIVDISEQEHLFEKYRLSIPVLARPDALELGWPFDPAMIEEFLER
ncbi:MAG: glutaredoxin family protein [Burkholderiales bacterium]|nr:glutaredoxin family protein [Burkholderiales bacterium]